MGFIFNQLHFIYDGLVFIGGVGVGTCPFGLRLYDLTNSMGPTNWSNNGYIAHLSQLLYPTRIKI